MRKYKIKRGDMVVIISGKEKGKSGEVLRVIRKKDRAIVRDCNMVTRHTRPSQTQEGGLIRKEASIHISNLAIADPKDNKASRVGYKFLKDGRKVRFSKRSGEVIDA